VKVPYAAVLGVDEAAVVFTPDPDVSVPEQEQVTTAFNATDDGEHVAVATGFVVSTVSVLFAAVQLLLPAESLHQAVHLYVPSVIFATVMFQYESLVAVAFVWFACHVDDQLPYSTKVFVALYVSVHFKSNVTFALELL